MLELMKELVRVPMQMELVRNHVRMALGHLEILPEELEEVSGRERKSGWPCADHWMDGWKDGWMECRLMFYDSLL